MKPWLHPVIVLEFLIEAEDAVGDSEFQKLDEFFCIFILLSFGINSNITCSIKHEL